MESNNLTTRTYTAPTCALIVSTKTEPRLNRQSGVPMDFILHLEDPDRSETHRITLHGQAQQLDRLQQEIDKYISALVAQFPLPGAKRIVAIDEPVPGAADRTAPTPEPAADTPSSARLNPHLDPRAARSGILKNLPGLQKDNTSAPPPASRSDDRSIIDKLLGRRPKPAPYTSITRPIGSGDGRVMPPSVDRNEIDRPYLTSVSDESVGGEVRQRSLDHQLHLGNLANPTSGETIILSAIQLFDLATVLDEYASEKLTVSPPTPSTAFERISIPVNSEQPIDLEAVVSRSRLPNLPHMASDPDANPTYYRTRRPRSSWMSALPWVAGATLAMVGGVFILDPNFKPFQDIASMMKSPSLGGAKKSTPVKPGAGELAQTPTTATTTTTTTTGTLPIPWQQQPVQPPQVANPSDSSPNAAQTPSKIGVAPLPDALVNQPGQTSPNPFDTPSTTQQSAAGILSSNGVQSATGIAPNPLNATQPPAVATKTITGTVKTSNPTAKAKPPAKTTTARTQLPTDVTTPGKLSVSRQPMPIPPLNAPAIVNPPPFKAIPFDAPTAVPNQIDPATRNPAPKKSAAGAAKPTPSAVLTPSSSSEPFTPVPRNPNLIDLNQPNSATPDLKNPPVVPNQPLQSNAGGIEPEVPLLQESRRYIQGKWKAGNNQPNSLQYVVQVNGKSGVVRSIDPQGEAASAYLRETKFIKPGQKLVSPAAAGSSDQKIRVLLQPDGNVDTFIEP